MKNDDRFQIVLKAMDEALEGLSPEDAGELLDRIGGEVDCREDCLREEAEAGGEG